MVATVILLRLSSVRFQCTQVISFTEGQLAAYVVVMIAVTGICLVLDVWYARRMHKMVLKMTKFSAKIHVKSIELVAEKKRADALLYEMMPREVADQLKMNKEVKAEHYDQCTVYFSDIVGFTTISARSSPLEVVSMLNSLYRYLIQLRSTRAQTCLL